MEITESGSAIRAASRIPTARNVDHYAFTVPDLDLAVAFFCDVLGAEVAYRLGPIASPPTDTTWMNRHLAVHPDARTVIAMLRLGPVTNIELFQYFSPDQRTTPPGNRDPGGHRLGFAVADLDAAVAGLRRDPRVTVLGSPQTVPDGFPHAGERWIYFRSPWGMYFSLHQVPPHLPYERNTDARRFDRTGEWTNTEQPAADPVIESARESGHAGPRIVTARHVDRVSYTVRDLDRAAEFFVGVLGAVPLYDSLFRPPSAEFMTTQWDVAHGGPVRTALFRVGPTANVELVEFPSAGSVPARPRNSDIGGHHLAFWVDDLDTAVGYLAARDGVTVLGGPIDVRTGPLAGGRWVYFLTPFGMTMEVLTFPDGSLPYEATTAVRRRAHELRPW